MSQKLPNILIEHMRELIESAPESIRPLVTRASALFLKREEPRWNRLSMDTRLVEERFYNFLNSPSTYDLLGEDLVPAIDVGRPLGGTQAKAVAEAPTTQPLGYAAGDRDKFTTCWDCDGTGQDWKDKSKKCYTCQGTGKALKSLREGAEDWKETRCELCDGMAGKACRSCGGKGWAWKNTKTGETDIHYGNPVRFGRVDEDRKCPVCDGQGWVWNHPEPGEDALIDAIECPHCHGEGTLKEDAPANAAGNGTVAGIGQPEGSAFGEPGFPLGGATTKTRKKNKRPEDLNETEYVWVCKKCGKMYGPARDPHGPGVPKKCPRCGSTEADMRDDSELDEGNASDVIPKTMDPNRITKLPSEHHYDSMADWVEKDKARIAKLTALLTIEKDPLTLAPIRSSLAFAKQELAKHEQELVKIAREIERYRADRAAGIHRDGKLPIHEETEKFAGGDVFEVDMDRWMNSRFGKNRYHRYSRYVGSDKVGEEIRTHGRTTKNDIVLKDQNTGVMTYLRRKKQMG